MHKFIQWTSGLVSLAIFVYAVHYWWTGQPLHIPSLMQRWHIDVAATPEGGVTELSMPVAHRVQVDAPILLNEAKASPIDEPKPVLYQEVVLTIGPPLVAAELIPVRTALRPMKGCLMPSRLELDSRC